MAAAPRYHRTRPNVRCCIPERLYDYREFSQPARSLSNVALPFQVSVTASGKAADRLDRPLLATGAERRQTIKSFQFVDRSKLQIDHCSISQMSVLLHESGHWTVSLRADQNPLPEQGRKVTTIEPTRKFTDHLKRNEFYVTVRCYAGPLTGGTDSLVGKPLVIPLRIQPFWVQRQEPYQLFETHHDPRIQDYFNLIERVEIEFAYRTD